MASRRIFCTLVSSPPHGMPLKLPPPRASGSASASASSSSAQNGNHESSRHVENLAASESSSLLHAGTSASSASSLKLPPPKTKSKQLAGQPKKFLLDLPAPSKGARDAETERDDAERAAKRARVDGSTLNIANGGGLRSLLPQPKAKTAVSESQASSTSSLLLPPSLKGKQKQTASEPQVASLASELTANEPGKSKSPPETDQAVLDFFGLCK